MVKTQDSGKESLWVGGGDRLEYGGGSTGICDRVGNWCVQEVEGHTHKKKRRGRRVIISRKTRPCPSNVEEPEVEVIRTATACEVARMRRARTQKWTAVGRKKD